MVEPYISISLTDTTYSSEDGCKIDDSLKLLDDNPITYMSIQGVLHLTIVSTEPLHEIMIVTHDMDCAKRFHVSVTVKRLANQCNKVSEGQLVSFTSVNGIEPSECWYAVPRGDSDIMIRLAAVHTASVYSITGYNQNSSPLLTVEP